MRSLAAALLVVVALASVALCASDVRDLSPSDFDHWVDGSAPAFVEFYAPWCGHCKRLAPEYEIIGSTFAKHKKDVVVARVDCDQHRELCSRFSVQGYPTLHWFPKGETKNPTPYNGGRTAADIVAFINKSANLRARIKGASVGALVDLDDTTFDKIVLDKSKSVFVEFYAPWCGHCKKLEPDYIKFADAFKGDADVVIARYNADDNKKAASRYGVQGYPTLKWFPKDNKKGVDYNEGRSLEELVSYVNTNAGKYRKVDGALTEEAGRIAALDDLVEQFKSATDKTAVIERTKKHVSSLTGVEERFGKLYVRAMEKLAAGEENYAIDEIGRLRRMVESVTATKADEFSMRINILSLF